MSFSYREFLDRMTKKSQSIDIPNECDFKEVVNTNNQKQIIKEHYSLLDSEQKKSFYLDYKMAVNNKEYYENIHKDSEVYDCPKCNNTLQIHFIDFYNDNTGHWFHNEIKPCSCVAVRKSLKQMEKNGLLGLIKKKNFSNFVVISNYQRELKSKAIEYTKLLLENGKCSFFVGGQSGSGKTHICSAILSELCKHGVCVNFFNYIQDIATLNRYQYSNFENCKEEYERILHDSIKADILYIDDFFYGDVSQSKQDIIFNIIDQRYKNELPCIISSEKTLNIIKAINISIYGRIREMSKDFIINIAQDDSKNYRGKII